MLEDLQLLLVVLESLPVPLHELLVVWQNSVGTGGDFVEVVRESVHSFGHFLTGGLLRGEHLLRRSHP